MRFVISTVRVRAIVVSTLAAVVVAVLALSLRSSPPVAHAAADTGVRSGRVNIKVSMYAFSPDVVTVKAGTRITFTNYDDTDHTATANHGAFSTGIIAPRHSRTVRFTKVGVDAYHCLFHAFMTGTIKVVK